MGALKKTALMVTGALGLLLGLGAADPGNTRLMTSFVAQGPAPGVLPKGSAEAQQMLGAVTRFNRSLSAAYLALDPAALQAFPIDGALRRRYAEEISFLKNDGRALEMTVRDIRIESVRRLADRTLSVDTVESVKIRYLSAADRRQIAAYPATKYAMNYVLAKSASAWKVVGVDTLRVEKRHE